MCSVSVHFLMFLLVNLSRMEIPSMDLKHLISKISSLFSTSVVITHVSEAYVAIGSMRALYRRIFSFMDIQRLFHTDLRSLPKADEGRQILLSTSSLTLGTKLPRYTKLSTFSSCFPSSRCYRLRLLKLYIYQHLLSSPILSKLVEVL